MVADEEQECQLLKHFVQHVSADVLYRLCFHDVALYLFLFFGDLFSCKATISLLFVILFFIDNVC